MQSVKWLPFYALLSPRHCRGGLATRQHTKIFQNNIQCYAALEKKYWCGKIGPYIDPHIANYNRIHFMRYDYVSGSDTSLSVALCLTPDVLSNILLSIPSSRAIICFAIRKFLASLCT